MDKITYSDGHTIEYEYDTENDAWMEEVVHWDRDFIMVKYHCDIETTENKYRMAIQIVFEDSENEDNVGVRSLYIIKAEDDPQPPDYAYWGDGKSTPGIHIGVTSENISFDEEDE